MPSVGIVGLPNVGKSTLFNALTFGAAQVSNYPFTTIDPNVGQIPVPDPLLDRLAERLRPGERIPCALRVIDIAGLVRGASRGEGLGNRFLGEIRSVDAIAHLLRAFEEPDVAHVTGDVDPVRDAETVEAELVLADLELVERSIQKRQNEWNTDPHRFAPERERFELFRDTLAQGRPLRSLTLARDELRRLKGLGLLTAKPVLYVLNVSEAEAALDPHPRLEELRASELWRAGGERAAATALCARLEAELLGLPPDERRDYLGTLGLRETGLERFTREAFRLLDLIRFYTVVGGKLQAWDIERGTTAAAAAGKIHSTMEEGFIRARVAAAEDLLAAGSFQALHDEGRLRTEGRGYEVRDGDVLEVAFRD